jgi:hypothetical protein
MDRGGEMSNDEEKDGMNVPAAVVGEGAVEPAMLISALVNAGSPTLLTFGINPFGLGKWLGCDDSRMSEAILVRPPR